MAAIDSGVSWIFTIRCLMCDRAQAVADALFTGAGSRQCLFHSPPGLLGNDCDFELSRVWPKATRLRPPLFKGSCLYLFIYTPEVTRCCGGFALAFEVGLGSQSSLPSMPMRAKASDRGGMLSGADPLESVESPRLHLCPVGVPLAPPPPPAPSMLLGMFGGFVLALQGWTKI